jgi:multidrug efflux system outer membrane protein
MKKSLLVLLLLSGCKGGYKAPDIALNNEFLSQEATLDEKKFNPFFWEALEDPTLNQLVKLVEEKNYDLLSAYEKIKELRAQYRFQNSKFFPQFSGTGDINRIKETQTLTYSRFLGQALQTTYALGFDTIWELDFFGVQQQVKRSAFFTVMSQVEQAAYTKLSLVSELVLQYSNLRTFQNLIDLYKKELKVLKEIEDLASIQFTAGLQDQTTTLTDLARVQDKQALLDRTQADVDRVIFLVTQLTGQFPDKEYEKLAKYVPLKSDIPLIYADIPSKIVLSRPDVCVARFNLFSAQANLKKAYRDFFPKFNITSNYGVLSNFANLLFKKQSINWNIMPGFNVTLIDFGALIAEKNVAKSKEKQALYAYENSLIGAFAEIETALFGVQASDRQIESLQEELLSLQEKTADIYEQFRIGLISKTNYLESYLEELLIKESLVNAINDRMGFTISFYKALGIRL